MKISAYQVLKTIVLIRGRATVLLLARRATCKEVLKCLTAAQHEQIKQTCCFVYR